MRDRKFAQSVLIQEIKNPQNFISILATILNLLRNVLTLELHTIATRPALNSLVCQGVNIRECNLVSTLKPHKYIPIYLQGNHLINYRENKNIGLVYVINLLLLSHKRYCTILF